MATVLWKDQVLHDGPVGGYKSSPRNDFEQVPEGAYLLLWTDSTPNAPLKLFFLDRELPVPSGYSHADSGFGTPFTGLGGDGTTCVKFCNGRDWIWRYYRQGELVKEITSEQTADWYEGLRTYWGGYEISYSGGWGSGGMTLKYNGTELLTSQGDTLSVIAAGYGPEVGASGFANATIHSADATKSKPSPLAPPGQSGASPPSSPKPKNGRLSACRSACEFPLRSPCRLLVEILPKTTKNRRQ